MESAREIAIFPYNKLTELCKLLMSYAYLYSFYLYELSMSSGPSMPINVHWTVVLFVVLSFGLDSGCFEYMITVIPQNVTQLAEHQTIILRLFKLRIALIILLSLFVVLNFEPHRVAYPSAMFVRLVMDYSTSKKLLAYLRDECALRENAEEKGGTEFMVELERPLEKMKKGWYYGYDIV